MTAHRYVCLSDIHLTVPHDWAAFRDQAELGKLLHHLAKAPSMTLVLAGDTFDFLLLSDYDGFNTHKSPDRLAEILQHADNEPVLKGLRAFVDGPHKLVLLAGNHDPEVLLPSVRARFAKLVGCDLDGLGGDELLHRPQNGKAAVWGLRIPAAGSEAWVVHGDRWDVSNFIDRAALLEAAATGQPVGLPTGSKLVYRVVRRLKKRGYNWVDQVKPEIGSVIPLLLYLDWHLTIGVLGNEWGLTANLLVGMLRHQVGATKLGNATAVTRSQLAPEMSVLVDSLRAAMPEPEPERRALLSTLASAEHFAPPRPRDGTLSGHHGFWRWLLRAWLTRARSSDRFFGDEKPDDITRGVAKLPGKVALMVAGHTHGRRQRALPEERPPLYMNAGTWTPVCPLPPGDIEAVIDTIERDELPTATSPRTAVDIRAGHEFEARLVAWDGEILR